MLVADLLDLRPDALKGLGVEKEARVNGVGNVGCVCVGGEGG